MQLILFSLATLALAEQTTFVDEILPVCKESTEPVILRFEPADGKSLKETCQGERCIVDKTVFNGCKKEGYFAHIAPKTMQDVEDATEIFMAESFDNDQRANQLFIQVSDGFDLKGLQAFEKDYTLFGTYAHLSENIADLKTLDKSGFIHAYIDIDTFQSTPDTDLNAVWEELFAKVTFVSSDAGKLNAFAQAIPEYSYEILHETKPESSAFSRNTAFC